MKVLEMGGFSMTVYDRSVREAACGLFDRGVGYKSAARAVVDGGMARAEAMARFGVVSLSPLDAWCRIYREGGAEPVMQMDMGWQYQHRAFTGRLQGLGVARSMSRKGNCLDNAFTEGLFGHMKDEFFRRRDWDDFEEFQTRPRGLHPPLEPRETPGQVEGPDPGGVPGADPSGRRLAVTIKRVKVLGRSSC